MTPGGNILAPITAAGKRHRPTGRTGLSAPIAAAGPWKIILSKPAAREIPHQKIVVEKKKNGYQAAAYTKTQVFHQNFSAEELTDYLIEEGHKKICFLSQELSRSSTVTERFEGYRDSNLEHGILTNENLWMTDINALLPQMEDREEALRRAGWIEWEQNVSLELSDGTRLPEEDPG